MKRIFLTITVLILMLSASRAQTGNVVSLDKNGFQGLHLDDPMSKFPASQLTKVDTVLDTRVQITYYTYHNPEALKLNDQISLLGIQIGIVEGQVAEVLFFYKKSDHKAIKTFLDQQFGKPTVWDVGLFLYEAAKSTLWLYEKPKGGRYVIEYGGQNQ